MPKLLLLVPCENLIVAETGITSIISVIESLEVGIKGNLPEDAIINLRWYILTLWRREQSDIGKTFEQQAVIVRPDGKSIGGGGTTFNVTEQHLNYRSQIEANVLPIGQQGECFLRLSIREKGQEDWREIAEYPFNIIHKLVIDEKAANEI